MHKKKPITDTKMNRKKLTMLDFKLAFPCVLYESIRISIICYKSIFRVYDSKVKIKRNSNNLATFNLLCYFSYRMRQSTI